MGLTAKTKREVIETLVDRLYATSPMVIPKAEFVRKVIARENEDTTCLGKGFMIPHATLEEGEEVHGVLGLSADGIALDAHDGRDVHAIVLLATPKSDRKRHLEILAAFASAITKNGSMREQLYASRSAAHAYDVLHADESEDMNYFLDDAILQVGVEEKRAQ